MSGRGEIEQAFSRRPFRPGVGLEARAAVAAVFRHGPAGSELLFIERARREGDPWSGHMALPGGRVDPIDGHPLATATRETAEELGLDLTPADELGRLDDLEGGARRITVSAFGFWMPGERPALEPNHEVADALWIPLDHLTDSRRFIDYDYPASGGTFPGILLDDGERVVWGMTLRLLHDLFDRLDRPFLQLGA